MSIVISCDTHLTNLFTNLPCELGSSLMCKFMRREDSVMNMGVIDGQLVNLLPWNQPAKSFLTVKYVLKYFLRLSVVWHVNYKKDHYMVYLAKGVHSQVTVFFKTLGWFQTNISGDRKLAIFYLHWLYYILEIMKNIWFSLMAIIMHS